MKPRDRNYDVLIVGGGLAGATLGCALRGTGLRVGILEAVPIGARGQPSFDDRSIALSYGSQRIFSALGLWHAMAPQGCPITRIHISNRGHFGFARLCASDEGVPALGYVIENRQIGKVLSEAIADAENIDWLAPAVVEDVSLDIAGATVSVRIGDQLSNVRGAVLVAADGANSIVRKRLNIDLEERPYDQVALVANVATTEMHRNVAFERFTSHGPLALLPMTENRSAMVWVVSPEDKDVILGLSDSAFLARLQNEFGWRLGRFLRVGKRATYPLTLTRATRAPSGRAVLIGNAAHGLHPVAGQGFNLSLRDVAVLAEVLFDAFGAGEDLGSAAVLARYHESRATDQRRIATFTDVLARVFANPLGAVALARNATLVAVDCLPPVKRALTRLSMGLAGKQPRLSCSIPLIDRESLSVVPQRVAVGRSQNYSR